MNLKLQLYLLGICGISKYNHYATYVQDICNNIIGEDKLLEFHRGYVLKGKYARDPFIL